jgi:hypothetical protein
MSEAFEKKGEQLTLVMTSQVFEIPDSDIEVLLEMAGYGIDYWASELTINGRYVTVTDLEEGGHNGETDTYRTNYTALAQALVDIGTGALESGYSEYARNYLNDGLDAGYFDSDIADHVVQYALFGELIYG